MQIAIIIACMMGLYLICGVFNYMLLTGVSEVYKSGSVSKSRFLLIIAAMGPFSLLPILCLAIGTFVGDAMARF